MASVVRAGSGPKGPFPARTRGVGRGSKVKPPVLIVSAQIDRADIEMKTQIPTRNLGGQIRDSICDGVPGGLRGQDTLGGPEFAIPGLASACVPRYRCRHVL